MGLKLWAGPISSYLLGIGTVHARIGGTWLLLLIEWTYGLDLRTFVAGGIRCVDGNGMGMGSHVVFEALGIEFVQPR
jgi:hypothetical protein